MKSYKKLNPCSVKGGLRYHNKKKTYASGCNCSLAHELKPCGKKTLLFDEPKKPIMRIDSHPHVSRFIPFSLLKGPVKDTKIKYSPCKESFFNSNSVALRAFKKEHESKFTGCQIMEDRLVKEGLVNHTQFDGKNAPSLLPRSYERNDDMNISPTMRVDDYFKIPLEKRRSHLFENKTLGTGGEAFVTGYYDFTDPTVTEMFRSGPENIKHMVLRKLIKNGTFNQGAPFKTLKSPLHLTAVLIDRRINEKNADIIKTIFPKYDVKKFKSLSSKVYMRVELELKKALDKKYDKHLYYMAKFDAFFKTLTKKQIDALKLTKMADVGEELTLEAAAKKLKISKASLIDRLDGVTKKIKKHYPELAKMPKGLSSSKIAKSDIAYNGFYRSSSSKEIHPVKTSKYINGKLVSSDTTKKPKKSKITMKPLSKRKREEIIKWAKGYEEDLMEGMYGL